ncbi:MAG TPA: LuxR C-terminal-related transcriptional regulator [Chroococcidiopsis sp.]
MLELLATGKNNRAIGEALGITEHTNRFHITNLITKLGASDRTDALVIAMRRGLIHF